MLTSQYQLALLSMVSFCSTQKSRSMLLTVVQVDGWECSCLVQMMVVYMLVISLKKNGLMDPSPSPVDKRTRQKYNSRRNFGFENSNAITGDAQSPRKSRFPTGTP